MRGLTLGDPALLGAAAGFSPLSLSPALWLDASDAATITSSGGKVSSWSDKSGNGRNATQGTSTNQPATGSATINGKNALTFDGNDYLGPTSSGISPSSNGITVFVVAQLTSDVGQAQIILGQADGTGTGRTIIGRQPSSGVSPAVGSFTFLGGTATYAGTYTTSAIINTTYCASGTNQTLTITHASSTGTATRTLEAATGGYLVGIGKALSTANCFIGNLAEIIVYGSLLSAADRTSVNNYLAQKWGL